jgi:dTDP-4-amino-4,6-dideoxygalactose transaminase
MPPFVPFHRPSIGPEEIQEVTAVLMSGWLTSGPRTAQFEADFRDYVGAPHALAVNSCTAGLHLALAALGIGPGDEVITTPLTFCATINAISHTGARPVLADIGPDGNLDPEAVEAALTPRTKAILPVHFGGIPCDMNAIWKMARQHGLFVVEDAAHAVGTRYAGHRIGAGNPDEGLYSDAVAFSFYATKNLTTGEGGMVTTHSAALAERMKVLCLHGISKDAWHRYSDKGSWYYEVIESGFKYNLSDLQSAIGIHQLRKLDSFIELRAQCAQRYNEAFAGVPELELPPSGEPGANSWHLYPLRLQVELLKADRRAFIADLKQLGVGASVHFIPIPLHPSFKGKPGLEDWRCENALALFPQLVSLPLYPDLQSSEIEHVIEAVLETVQMYRTEPLKKAVNA